MPTDTPTSEQPKAAKKNGNGKGGDGKGGGTYLPDIHRLLPQSADAEQGILCSILLAPKEVGGLCVERGIRAEHFHIPAHASIYTVLKEMYDACRPIDLVTLTPELLDRKLLDQAGGSSPSRSYSHSSHGANASYYLEIVEEKYTLREIIRVAPNTPAAATTSRPKSPCSSTKWRRASSASRRSG